MKFITSFVNQDRPRLKAHRTTVTGGTAPRQIRYRASCQEASARRGGAQNISALAGYYVGSFCIAVAADFAGCLVRTAVDGCPYATRPLQKVPRHKEHSALDAPARPDR